MPILYCTVLSHDRRTAAQTNKQIKHTYGTLASLMSVVLGQGNEVESYSPFVHHIYTADFNHAKLPPS